MGLAITTMLQRCGKPGLKALKLSLIKRVILCLTTLLPTFLLTEIPSL